MPLKILIVPDKFKGTLSAAAAAAIARGWRQARPRDRLEMLPMSDGGDGFGETLGKRLRARPQRVQTVDAAHRRRAARWWWEPDSKTALIESARVIGLALLPPGRFHPFDLDTAGLGAVLRAARARGARRCVVGLGGSATNDGGFGLARALGWKFLDRQERPLEQWTGLRTLERIIAPPRRRWFDELIAAVDVRNPLSGPRGATRVYGPQKGLRPHDLENADACLRRLARVFKRQFHRDLANIPGAGAAGGREFGLLAFTGARVETGFDLFARQARLDERLRAADLVITGEGRIDAPTLMGKGAGEIARRCRRLKIPCAAIAGEIDSAAKVRRTFTRAFAITGLTTVANAKSQPARWLERVAAKKAIILAAMTGTRSARLHEQA